MAREDELHLVVELRAAVRECGLSLSELARRSKVSGAQLSRFMSGKTLTLVTAAKLFEFFGLRVLRPAPFPPDYPSA